MSLSSNSEPSDGSYFYRQVFYSFASGFGSKGQLLTGLVNCTGQVSHRLYLYCILVSGYGCCVSEI